MNINQLILIIKNKLKKNFLLEEIIVEDKTFLHQKHKSHKEGKFHVKLSIKSLELKSMNKLSSTKKIYNVLGDELKNYIHSIQISIN